MIAFADVIMVTNFEEYYILLLLLEEGITMTDAQQREAARQFFYSWRDKGNEDEHARSFWIELLSDILGVENVTKRLDFEKKVIGPDGNTKRIDVYIPETHVLIEQKSLGIALDKPQAGHNGMPIKETDEAACVAWLMRLYQEKSSGNP